MKSVHRSKILFYIAYIVYLFSAYFPKTAFYATESETVEIFLKGSRYVAYSLLLTYAIWEKHHKDKFVTFLLTFFLLGILLYKSNRVLLFATIFIYLSDHIDYRILIRYSFYFSVIMWFILIAAILLGVIDNILVYTPDLFGGRYRYCLGFKHPNNTSEYFVLTMLQFFWMKKDRIRSRDIFVAAILSFNIYFFTLSRSGILISVFFFLLILFRKYLMIGIEKSKIIYIFVCYSIPVLSVINILIVTKYILGGFESLDMVLHGRIALSAHMIVEKGIRIGGQAIDWDYGKSLYNIVDSSYIRDLIEYGIVGYLLIVKGYVSSMKYALKCKDIILVISIVCIAVYSISENLLMYFPINPFIIMFGATLKADIKIQRRSYEKKLEKI